MFDSKIYLREYLNRRYAARRQEAFQLLGGRCVECGVTDKLEIDHVDRARKKMTFTRMAYASRDRFLAELQGCQLLCQEHHILKTILERGTRLAKGTHGTLSSYRYCRCDLCRAAKSEHNRRHYKRP